MDEFDLPDDLKDDVEVIYLDDDVEVEEAIDEFPDDEEPEEQIMTEVIDLAKLTFDKHKKPVFASDLSSDGKMALTGGEDDMAYLWDVATGEVILECTGHKDSVSEVGFSFDNQYIVSGDMGGLIQVWSIKDKKLIWCYEGDDMQWLMWHHITNVLIAGFHAGDVYIFQIPQGNCKVIASHGASASDGKLLPDGKRLVVGYNDGQIKLWDIKSTTAIWTFNDPHVTEINSLDVNQDGNLLALAPSGHIIKLTDGKLIGTVMTDGETEIETCCFNSELGIIATGALSGQICIWELGRQTIRHQAKVECTVTITRFGTNGKLLVGAVDGAIYLCDARTGLLIETLTGHEYGVLSLSISKDGSFVLSTAEDGTAKIFTIKAD